MINIKYIRLLGLLALMLCSCSSVKTSVEKSGYMEDTWIIRSEGNLVTFDESVFNDAKKQAAEKSNSEGMDCFVVILDEIYPREAKTTETMYGESSELYYSDPWASLFVSFHNYDDCKYLEKTKGKDKVFYNNETIKSAKSIENKNLMKEILVWGGSACLMLLVIYYELYFK